ncbi:MnhB domain-containing protein [Halospeciosus flavus]|uniref:MnhB domain-containing protein n=1 Tax=Halospeciosus flavus TaxID=3032283 RepID=A0ABD5Z4C2_9EURY|nr:MnhB domain-containing protein [Halospeciosus flavus]
MTTVILRTATRAVVPIILVTSFALFLQGHNLPGGGFIAGVLTATAFALVYVAFGLDFLEEEVLGRNVTEPVDHIRHGVVADYRTLFAVGLATAVVSGLAAVAMGYQFLSFTDGYTPVLPLYGKLHWANAVVFDLGVYAVVVGSLLTILSVVGEE